MGVYRKRGIRIGEKRGGVHANMARFQKSEGATMRHSNGHDATLFAVA